MLPFHLHPRPHRFPTPTEFNHRPVLSRQPEESVVTPRSFAAARNKTKRIESNSVSGIDRAIIVLAVLQRRSQHRIDAGSVFRVPGIQRWRKEAERESPLRGERRIFSLTKAFSTCTVYNGPRFSARDDYPVVQFMSANDCNLRLIQRCEMVPGRSLSGPSPARDSWSRELRLACTKVQNSRRKQAVRDRAPLTFHFSWSKIIRPPLYVPSALRVSRLAPSLPL